MPIAITTALLGATVGVPASVQIAVTGLASGDNFTVQGSHANHHWPVPGGISVSDGNQLVLADNRAPFNGELVYTVTVSGIAYQADPVTVEFAATTVLQSLDGRIVAIVEVADPTDPRTTDHRAAAFMVAGRMDPVMRIDVPASPQMKLEVEANGVHAQSMTALAATGKPMVRRNTVGLRGIPPVELLIPFSSKSQFLGAVGTLRSFTLNVQVIGDPEPATALTIFDWDDFDANYATLDWDDFDAAWSGRDWNDFDKHDWGV